MSGGTAFATRDDLNQTNSVGYSSHPFVLVKYQAVDGRPAMTPFRVVRENPAKGWVFDYVVQAGQLLQAPMPLPLLAKPVEGTGESATNFNTEPTGSAGDLPGGWIVAGGAVPPVRINIIQSLPTRTGKTISGFIAECMRACPRYKPVRMSRRLPHSFPSRAQRGLLETRSRSICMLRVKANISTSPCRMPLRG